MFYLSESKYDRSHPKFKTTVLQNSSVYLCFIMQCMMPLWATTSVETNKGIRTKHEHRQPRKFCHAHITIIYIVSATKEILIKWGKKCVLVMPKTTGKKKIEWLSVSAIERRNALTFSLLDNFPDNLSTGGEVGIKIPYSRGTMCENQLDFSAILSIAAAAAVICLATWQPPERGKHCCTEAKMIHSKDVLRQLSSYFLLFENPGRRMATLSFSSFRENLLRLWRRRRRV